MNVGLITLAIACPFVIGPWAPAADVDLVSQLRKTQGDQEHLQIQTQQLAHQLDSVLHEYQLNGLSSLPEAVTLAQTRQALNHLSRQEMAEVVVKLRSARIVGPDKAAGDLAEARTAQAGIIQELNLILLQYSRERALASLADQFNRLSERELANLRDTLHLQEQSGGGNAATFGDAQSAELHEQASLKSDLDDALSQLVQAAETSDPQNAQRLRVAADYAAAGHLVDEPQQVVADIGAGRLYAAGGEELNLYQALAQLAQWIDTPISEPLQLQAAGRDLAVAVQDGKNVLSQMRSLDVPAMDDHLLDLSIQSNRIRGNIADIAPTAAESLDAALDQIAHARQLLSEKKPDDAASLQANAIQLFETARKLIADQLAQELAQPTLPQDQVAQLKAVAEAQERLIEDEQTIMWSPIGSTQQRDAAAQKQGALVQRSLDMQQQLQAMDRDSAVALGQAAAQMTRAQSALRLGTSRDLNDAATEQAGAMEGIKQSRAAVRQSIEHKQDEQRDQSTIDDALTKLALEIESQQNAYTDAAALHVNPLTSTKSPAEVTQTQSRVADGVSRLDLRNQAIPDRARNAVAEAQSAAALARSALEASDFAGALQRQKDSMSALYRARDLLAQRRDAIADDLQQPLPTSGDADLARQLEAAQKRLADSPDEVGAIAAQIGRLAAETHTQSPAMEQALIEAQQALSDAAARGQDHSESGTASLQVADQALSLAQVQVEMIDPGVAVNSGNTGQAYNAAARGSAVATGAASFTGLPPRDRQSLEQSEGDSYPPAYAEMVEQYRKNLAAEH